MKHKKFAALLCALLSLSLLTACGGKQEPTGSGSGSTSQPPQEPSSSTSSGLVTVEPGKLHMSTHAQFAPYEMVADDGSFEGIDVEVAGLIAQKLGLELVVDDMNFTACLEAVQNGKSDMAMAGITVTDDRKVNMDFSDTYATGIQVVIVPENSPIQTPDDLASCDLIGVQEGTTGYIYCSDKFGEDHVVVYEDGPVAIQALINGKADCVVLDNAPAKAYVANNPGLKILDSAFSEEDYAICLKKGDTAMMEAVNGALAELIADGSVQKVVEKYIPVD